jgi:hypothetical protein
LKQEQEKKLKNKNENLISSQLMKEREREK